MKTPVIIFILFFGLVCKSFSQKTAEVIGVDKLMELINDKSEKVRVINFWATWCGPCVKELPYFEKFGADNPDQVEVILISLDFVEKLDRVNNFIQRRGLASQVYLLDDIDYDSWIGKVSNEWSGAIPATMFIDSKSGKHLFFEKEMQEGDLTTIYNILLN